jgi:hypothetical protein
MQRQQQPILFIKDIEGGDSVYSVRKFLTDAIFCQADGCPLSENDGPIRDVNCRYCRPIVNHANIIGIYNISNIEFVELSNCQNCKDSICENEGHRRICRIFELSPKIKMAVERIHSIVCFDTNCQIHNCSVYKNKLQEIVSGGYNSGQWQNKLTERLLAQKRQLDTIKNR